MEHVWREHFPAAGEIIVVAELCVPAAGMSGSVIEQRRRGHRLPVDEVLPSSAAFTVAAVGTAVWALPYCCRHPALVPPRTRPPPPGVRAGASPSPPPHRPIRTPRSTVTWSMSETRTVSFIVQAPSRGRVRSLEAQ